MSGTGQRRARQDEPGADRRMAARAQLERWRAVALELEGVLNEPEPDAGRVVRLLQERARAQSAVAELLEAHPALERSPHTPGPAGHGGAAGLGAAERGVSLGADPELRELAASIVAIDRRCMALAGAVQARALEHLRQARGRRQMAGAYRRAVIEPATGGPVFFDRQI